MCIPLKPVFSRHKGDGVQITDEPTGNLDSKTERIVMDLLTSLATKYGTSILLVTHNENLTKAADRILRLEDGEIIHG